MAHTITEAKITSPSARARLKRGRYPHWRTIVPGKVHLGYQVERGDSEGRWMIRRYLGERISKHGKSGSHYRIATLGRADDSAKADGESILSYAQAQARVLEVVDGGAVSARKGGRLTVRQAVDDYVGYLRAHKKTADDAAARLAKHVLPWIGDRLVVELTKAEIERVQRAMVRRDPDDPEVERRSKDSSNRVMSSLKAALNLAFGDDDNGIPTDAAWRRVKPFKDVGRPRLVHLDAAQCARLINSTAGAFRRLVVAALYTGARPPHELATLRVRDFHADLSTLSVRDGKTGPRDVTLTEEAVDWFRGISAGRAPDALLLPKDDGTAWGKSHHTRNMIEAVAKAKLPEDTTIYALRHTYASQNLLTGTNIKLLADNMGTSTRMVEVHYGKFVAAARRKLVEEFGFKLGVKPDPVVTPLR